MAVADRVEEGLHWWRSGRPEAALLPISAAIDATVQAEYGLSKGTKSSYKQWLRENTWVVCVAGLRQILTPKIMVPALHPDLNPDANGRCDLTDVLYHVVRCGLVHQADISKFIGFSADIILGCEPPRYVVADTLPLGLAVAAILSPANAGALLANDSVIPIWQWQFGVNSLWGQREMLAGFVGEAVKRRMTDREMREGSSGVV